jgi:hypothetical protein
MKNKKEDKILKILKKINSEVDKNREIKIKLLGNKLITISK